MLLQFIILCFGTAHLTLLLKEAEILNRPRTWLIEKHPLLKRLFECPLCLNFWAALFNMAFPPLSVALAIMGLAHVIYLYRDKNLPCSSCVKPASETTYKIVR